MTARNLLVQPAAFCSANLGCGYGTDHAQDIKFAKGTTTLAFKVWQYNIICYARHLETGWTTFIALQGARVRVGATR